MFKWFKFGVAGVSTLLIVVGIIIGIAVTVIFNLHVDKQKKMTDALSTETKNDFNTSEKSNENKEKATIKKGVLTKDNFDLLEEGMSYKEAVDILGAEGEKDSERMSDSSHSITYLFAEDTRGIDISLSLSDDELTQKVYTLFTHKETEAIMSAEDFDKLKPGMSYEEVNNIVGGEGILVMDFGFADSDYHSTSYKYSGNSKDASASLSFHMDELNSKSQNQLQ